MIKALLFLTVLVVIEGAKRSLTEPHPDCPEEGHWLLPHEYDCTKFYYCDRGQKFVNPTDCPANTEFSPELQVCTHAGTANCNLPGATASPTDSPVESTEGSTTATDTPEDGTAQSVELLENGCPADSNVHMLLTHETSCSKFYYCVHGEKVLRSCAPGTVFNPSIQVCDHPGSIDRDCNDDESEDDNLNSSNESDSGNDNGNNGSREDDVNDGSSNNSSENDGDSNENDNGNTSNEDKNDSNENDSNSSSNEVEDGINSIEDDGNGSSNEADDGSGNDGDSNSNEADDGNSDSGDSEEDDIGEIELLPNGCPIEWSVSKYLPEKYNCSKTYQCLYGSIEEKACPEGTHFSYEVFVDVTMKESLNNKPIATLKVCVTC